MQSIANRGRLHWCRVTSRKASPVRISQSPINDKSPPPPRLSSHVMVSWGRPGRIQRLIYRVDVVNKCPLRSGEHGNILVFSHVQLSIARHGNKLLTKNRVAAPGRQGGLYPTRAHCRIRRSLQGMQGHWKTLIHAPALWQIRVIMYVAAVILKSTNKHWCVTTLDSLDGSDQCGGYTPASGWSAAQLLPSSRSKIGGYDASYSNLSTTSRNWRTER